MTSCFCLGQGIASFPDPQYQGPACLLSALLEFSSCISPHEVLKDFRLFWKTIPSHPVLGCVCVGGGGQGMGPSHVQHFSRRDQVLLTAGLQPAEGLPGGKLAPSAASTPLRVTGHVGCFALSCLPRTQGSATPAPIAAVGRARTHHSKFLEVFPELCLTTIVRNSSDKYLI